MRTLTDIWMGYTSWSAALRSRSLELTGPSQLRRALPRWLKLSSFARVAPVTPSWSGVR